MSAAARDLGLVADPTVLQQFSVVVESADPAALIPFWQQVLDYSAGPDGDLVDPLQRDPALYVRPSTETRPLHDRVHLDVVRSAEVESASPGGASGPHGARHADRDGNEGDLVPGDTIDDSAGTADRLAVFSAMACYRVTSTSRQGDLAAAAAGLADVAGFPLMIDLRAGLVKLDSGKDRWDASSHGLDVDFTALATDLQRTARDLGAVAGPGLARFVQVFQQLDTAEADRRRQRNRIHVELAVPSDLAPTRLARAVAAGGRLFDESPDRWRVADPEGNELVPVSES